MIVHRVRTSLGLFRFPDNAGGISRLHARGVMHEAALLAHIRRQGVEGRVVDVGANVGGHTAWFSRLPGVTAVEAFEPVRYDLLAQTVELNQLDNVTIHRTALSDRQGLADVVTHYGGEPTLAVTATLDSYRWDDVALVKVDCEGMEAQVLRGGYATINRCQPVVYAECLTARQRLDIYDALPDDYKRTRRFGNKGNRVGKWVRRAELASDDEGAAAGASGVEVERQAGKP